MKSASKEAELKKKRKQRERQENLLKSVKTNRRYARLVEGYRALVSVTPGGAKKNNVIEVTFQIFEPKKSDMAETKIVSKLKRGSDGDYGQKKRSVVASDTNYIRISRAGTYGFHYTPTMNGTYNVGIKGTKKDGVELIFDIPLYVGAHSRPTRSFPAEEEAYEAATQGTGKGRRVMATEQKRERL